MTYQESIKRLEEITQQISGGQTDIDQLVTQLTEAKQLLADCQKQLTEVEEQVNAINKTWEKEN